MSTPGTAEVRAWARTQGIAVAERGRVPAKVHAAYLASTSGKPAAAGAGRSTATASANKPAVRKAAGKAPARKAPARKAPAKAAATKAPTTKAPTTKAPTTKAAATKAAATKAAATKAAAGTATTSTAPAASTRTPSAGPELSPTVHAPSAAPAAPVTAVDDGRLARLEEQVSALTARVAELEKPQAPKAALFRRKKG